METLRASSNLSSIERHRSPQNSAIEFAWQHCSALSLDITEFALIQACRAKLSIRAKWRENILMEHPFFSLFLTRSEENAVLRGHLWPAMAVTYARLYSHLITRARVPPHCFPRRSLLPDRCLRAQRSTEQQPAGFVALAVESCAHATDSLLTPG